MKSKHTTTKSSVYLYSFLLFFFLIPASYRSQSYEWAKAIGGTVAEDVNSITVDASGNVYVIGSFYYTADFDPGAGTATLSSAGSSNVFFAKYDGNGNYLWAKSVGGAGGDEGYSIAVDASGNVYITGFFQGTADFDPGVGTATLSLVGNSDMFFAKYDSNGNYLWAKSVSGAGGSVTGRSIVLDALANVYLTGSFGGASAADFDPSVSTATLSSAGSGDIFFAKYDSNGNYLWAKNVGGTNADYGNSIALDAFGNVYVTGYFQGTADFDPDAGIATLTSVENEDIFFAKYGSTGNYLWAKSVGGTNVGGYADDSGFSIALDATGNVYVTGYFRGTADFDPSVGTATLTSTGFSAIFFAKYDNTGNYLWAKSVGGTSSYVKGTVDATGNIYITGTFGGTNAADFDPGVGTATLSSMGSSEIFFAKYNSNGNYLWARSVGGSSDDYGRSVALDASGNVYLTGSFSVPDADFNPGSVTTTLSATGNSDIFFAKYSPCVNPTVTASSGTICSEEVYTMSVNGASLYSINNVATTVFTFNPINTATYTVQGTDNNGCVGNPVTATIYVDECLGVDELKIKNLKLTVYPNPSNGIVNIQAEQAINKIEIFEYSGKQVGFYIPNTRNFELKENSLVSGLYIFKISTASYTTIQKVVIE